MNHILDILEILNDWDPIGLFPMAPPDEYILEAEEICKLMNNTYADIKALGKIINQIFEINFGDGVYIEDISKCEDIARKILERTHLY